MATNTQIHEQIAAATRVTRALLKFCRDHQRSEADLLPVERCLECLERRDALGAVEHFRGMRVGAVTIAGGAEWGRPAVTERELHRSEGMKRRTDPASAN